MSAPRRVLADIDPNIVRPSPLATKPVQRDLYAKPPASWRLGPRNKPLDKRSVSQVKRRTRTVRLYTREKKLAIILWILDKIKLAAGLSL